MNRRFRIGSYIEDKERLVIGGAVREKYLEHTAHHEAGHAVTAWWLGQLKKRDFVTIIPDPRTGSLGYLRNPPRFLPKMEESSGNSGSCDRMVLQAEKFVVVCLAGNAASCRHRKMKKRRYLAGGRSDREQAVVVLGHLVCGEELTAHFHLLQLRAENLVARFWPEVESVAQRLLSEKTLTSEQIRETCLYARKPRG
jgi:hypothetical protein